jgi:hypothetical protein
MRFSELKPAVKRYLPTFRGASLPLHRISSALLSKRQQLALPRDLSRDGARFHVSVSPKIPRLSWICERAGHEFRFTLGAAVQAFEGGFFEGVWTGNRTDTSKLAGALHYGSGVLFGHQPTFLPPKHLYEHIYIVRNKKSRQDCISNSLCFALQAAEVSEDFMGLLDRILVENTHKATRAGTHRSLPRVVEDDDYILFRMMYHNFSINPAGGIHLHPHYHGHHFDSFLSYKNMLCATLASLFDNGAGAGLSPLTSLSRGYDSVAVSALAARMGCRDAATLAVSVYNTDDCGSDIGSGLGLRVRELPHAMGARIENLETRFEGELASQAAEFIATAGTGDDLAFLGFEPVLRDRIFLTGAWGDSIWPKFPTIRAGLPIRIRFGKSLTEFRLRVGFAHVPVPTIGALVPQSIADISKSPEMEPFSVGGEYDRPIPRRIAEEAGVPRRAFGVKKAATAPDPQNRQALWLPSMRQTMARYPTG